MFFIFIFKIFEVMIFIFKIIEVLMNFFNYR